MGSRSKIVIDIVGKGESFQKAMRDAKKQTQGLSDSLKSVAVGSGVAFTGFIATIGGAVNEAKKFEKINTQFEVLTGSVTQAKNAVKDLSDFSASTPFQFQDVADAGSQLLGFGFAADELKDRLQAIGDVAAASNKPIKDVALIYGQVSAAGKLTGERLLQLQERAIPIGPALAETMGIAETSVKEMVTRGKVDFATFQKAFESLSKEGGKSFGGMAKASQDLEGQLSTLSDNVSLIAADIGKDFLPAIKEITSGLIEFLQEVRKNEELKAMIVNFLKVGAVVTGVISAISGLGVAALAAKTVLAGLAVIGGPITIAVAAMSAAIGAAVLYWDNLKAAGEATVQSLSGVFETIAQFYSGLGNIIKGVATFDSAKIEQGLSEIQEAFSQAGERTAVAFADTYNKALDENLKPIGDSAALATELDNQNNIIKEKIVERGEIVKGLEEEIDNLRTANKEREVDAVRIAELEKEKEEQESMARRLDNKRKYGELYANLNETTQSKEFQGTKKAFDNLSTLQRSNNRTAFEVGKAASIARAIMNTAQGVTEALKYGPFVGPLLAGSIAAAGAVQIGTIQSTTFQAKEGYSGGGSAFGESFVSTFTPREIVIPERFAEGLKKGEYTLGSKNSNPGGSGTEVVVNINRNDGLGDIIDAEIIERRKLGVSGV